MERREWDHWELTDQAREAAQAYVDHLHATAPEFLSLQMRRLTAMSKVHVPPLTSREAGWLVDFLCGFSLDFADEVPTESIAEMIATEIRETFVVDFGAEGLAEEQKRFSDDPDWDRIFRNMPEMLFANRMAKLDPLQAYLAVVATECYWQTRHATGTADLTDYFTIAD